MIVLGLLIMLKSIGRCIAFNISILQLAMSPIWILILYILFLKFFSFSVNEQESRENRRTEYNRSFIVCISIVTIAVILATLAGVMYYDFGVDSKHMVIFAQICGGVSSVVILFQWLPQIYTIFKKKVISQTRFLKWTKIARFLSEFHKRIPKISFDEFPRQLSFNY